MTTRRAACSCGQLTLTITGEPVRISMCHCLECQRRTGAVTSNQARFAREQIAVTGKATEWTRTAESGNVLTSAVVTRLGVFTLEALVICFVSGALRQAKTRAQTLARSEQEARRALEAAANQVRAVQRVTDTALPHLRLDDLLGELLGRVREVLSADTVVILLLNDAGTELVVRAGGRGCALG